MLRIAGEKKEEEKREENERGYRLTERRYGAFERILGLPATGEGENIRPKFRNGVLRSRRTPEPSGSPGESPSRKLDGEPGRAGGRPGEDIATFLAYEAAKGVHERFVDLQRKRRFDFGRCQGRP